MKPFGTFLPQLASRLEACGRIGLFLDFDGTLALIAARPEQAYMPECARQRLQELATGSSAVVAMISGRELGDLRRRAMVSGAIYVGNHGLEIEADGWRWVHPEAASRQETLRRLCDVISAELQGLAGVQVEYKRLTATVHYRGVQVADQPAVRQRVRSTVAASGTGFLVRPGRCSLEIRPDVDWNKGHAVQLLAARLRIPERFVFYFGDDHTDEDAFAALPQGITVRVGEALGSRARYRVRDPSEVHSFLEWLAQRCGHSAVAGAV